MTEFGFLNQKWKKALFGLFLFAMLLLARDTLVTSSILGFTRAQALMLALTALLGVAFLAANRKRMKAIVTDRRVGILAFLSLLLLLPMVVKRDWQMMYFSILFCLVFAVFLTYFVSVRDVAKPYVVILTALAAYSVLATYGLKELAGAGVLKVPVFCNSNDWDFYNFGFCYVVTWPLWHRNFGIFREPGVYQFFLLLALYLNNYRVDWKRVWTLWLVNGILAVTMVTTFAIGGIAELGLLAVFVYFDQKWYRKKAGRIAGLCAVAAVLAILAHILITIRTTTFEFSIYYEFYDMFLRLTTPSDSSVDRLSAIFTDLSFFGKHPLFGDTLAEVLHGTNHNTSSTLIQYAIFGVLGGSLHVAAWVALTWERKRSIVGNLCLLGILFLSFNTQNLVADVFFWLFPVMALTERGLAYFRTKGGQSNGKDFAAQGAADSAGDRQGDQAGL